MKNKDLQNEINEAVESVNILCDEITKACVVIKNDPIECSIPLGELTDLFGLMGVSLGVLEGLLAAKEIVE